MNLKTSEHPALSLFAELLSVPAPSGQEHMIARIIQQKLDTLGYPHTVDGSGNISVQLKGQQPDTPKCMIAAHIDEIAIVVTRIEDDGTLQVSRSGGMIPWKLGERPVEILGDYQTIIGVTSMGSGHTASAKDKVITWPDVRVLTGLTPDQLEAAGVRPGSTGVPLRTGCGPVLFGDPQDPMVAAWTFDDRMGAVALLRLLEAMKNESIEPYHPTTIAFTTQEEVGGQGVKALAQREKPKVLIAIDGCPIPPGSSIELDSRPGIWSKDSLSHYDQHLIRFFLETAIKAGTALQPVVYDQAASDASMAYTVGAAERIAIIGHVRENSHGYEVSRLAVFDNLFKVLLQFIKTWKGE